jgi:hypothetical protein
MVPAFQIEQETRYAPTAALASRKSGVRSWEREQGRGYRGQPARSRRRGGGEKGRRGLGK